MFAEKRIPVDIPPAWIIDKSRRQPAGQQLPAYAPELSRDEGDKHQTEENGNVVSLV